MTMYEPNSATSRRTISAGGSGIATVSPSADTVRTLGAIPDPQSLVWAITTFPDALVAINARLNGGGGAGVDCGVSLGVVVLGAVVSAADVSDGGRMPVAKSAATATATVKTIAPTTTSFAFMAAAFPLLIRYFAQQT